MCMCHGQAGVFPLQEAQPKKQLIHNCKQNV